VHSPFSVPSSNPTDCHPIRDVFWFEAVGVSAIVGHVVRPQWGETRRALSAEPYTRDHKVKKQKQSPATAVTSLMPRSSPQLLPLASLVGPIRKRQPLRISGWPTVRHWTEASLEPTWHRSQPRAEHTSECRSRFLTRVRSTTTGGRFASTVCNL